MGVDDGSSENDEVCGNAPKLDAPEAKRKQIVQVHLTNDNFIYLSIAPASSYSRSGQVYGTLVVSHGLETFGRLSLV